MEKLGIINNVKEVFDIKFNGGYSSKDGYLIETDKKSISILIDNGQSCCESWGYFSSEDDLRQFIGAELTEINLTDVALNKARLEEETGDEFDCGGIQFVDFVTNKGVFQLAVYNAHNGHYGHSILVAIDEKIVFNDVL